MQGMARAVWADIRSKDFVQGGSTITQQFIKNQYTEQERTVSRKLKEAALSWRLEQRWSKDRILTAYLNTIYFGNGAYGIEMASARLLRQACVGAHAPGGGTPRRHAGQPGRLRPGGEPGGGEGRRKTVLGSCSSRA